MKFNSSDKINRLLAALAAGILGNLLSFLSTKLTSLNPQVAFDFSHLATFIVALAFGPLYGIITGAIGAIYPYIHFSLFGIYGPLFGLSIIFGKSMTGFFCGLLRKQMPVYLAVTLSFIPESLFIFGFLQFMILILPSGSLTGGMISNIITEAWVEVIIFSFLIDNVMRRKVIETAVLMLEIFIIMFLVHKEFIDTLLVILLITLITLILFDLIKPFIKEETRK